ncbi:[NiFe]-hydrogenase assembly chaperone HybE [Motiliproteus sp. MSK22-1]|uniref:[NiFe]-hydrogenase assembly chaperone HybE n=1 Tax=Motiliproteus sp. MSK22-1 TaxID=1897630 RepID=UPI0009759B40|nr:[NiFe]-hydrogenase assembly chaperone HybE [Motiliproteus sp. MSK22-1]OMH32072.1 hypothetical protein BGP75_15290 [Motiliproteus sp. MSK22-1]
MRRISLLEKSYKQSLAAKAEGSINPALEVAAVQFQDYQGQVLGVIITPWFMGLILLPLELEGWRDHQTGDSHTERLPAGEFEFVHGWDPGFGAYGSCPLFSPMDEFPDQATAIQMAERAMEQLFKEPSSEKAAASQKVEKKNQQKEASQGIVDKTPDANEIDVSTKDIAGKIGQKSRQVSADKTGPAAVGSRSPDSLPGDHSKGRNEESVDMRRRGLFTGALFGRK